MSGEEQRISTTSFASSGFSLEDSYNVQHQSPPEQPVDAAGVLVHEEDLQSEEAADVVYVADNYQVEIKHSSITASIVKNEPYAESEEIVPEKEGQSDDEQQMIEEKQQVMIVVEEGMGHGNEIGIEKENDEEQHETRPAEQLEEINGRAGRPESPIVPEVTPLVQPQPRKSIVLNDSDDANKIEEPKPIRPFSLGSENAVRPQYIEEKKGQIQQQKSVESPSSEEKIMAQMRAKKNVSNLIAKFSTVSVTESNDQRNGCSKQKERLEVGVSKIDQLRQKFSQQ